MSVTDVQHTPRPFSSHVLPGRTHTAVRLLLITVASALRAGAQS